MATKTKAATLQKTTEGAHDILVKGARTHNLKDVTVSFPRNKLIVGPISSLDTMQLELAPGGGLAMRIAARNPHAPRSAPKPKPRAANDKAKPEFDVE